MANNDKRNEVTNGVSVPDAPQQEGAFLSELRALAAQLDTMNLRDVGGRRYGDLVLCAVRALSGSVPEATAAEVRRLTHELDNAQQALRRVGLLPIREPTPDATAGSGEAGEGRMTVGDPRNPFRNPLIADGYAAGWNAREALAPKPGRVTDAIVERAGSAWLKVTGHPSCDLIALRAALTAALAGEAE